MTMDERDLQDGAPTEDRAGTLIEGKYRVGELIGRGGMGAVYRGADEALGGVVAIKFLHRMFAWDPALRARFRREAQALSRVRHPGIVSLLDFGELEGEPYMVMEYLEGRPLSQLIEAGPLALPFIAKIFDELLEVIDVAHAAGLVHRDIKPSNVMILPGDRIKLLDFGLVRLPDGQEKLTLTGIAHGTPDYMSPEQSQGELAGPASDVYSASVLLYECLAGESPFEGASGAVVMAQHLFVEPPPMNTRGHKREIPRALEELVRRGLAKRPLDRPTAAGMRAELAAILKGTDPLTLSDQSAQERRRTALLTRGERTVTGRPGPLRTPRGPGADRVSDSEHRGAAVAPVEIRVKDEARATAIRNALAVGGVTAKIVRGDEELQPTLGAVVLSASDGLDLVLAAAAKRVPSLVVDVGSSGATRDCIRAGASDIVLSGGADSKLAPLVTRLLRRKR